MAGLFDLVSSADARPREVEGCGDEGGSAVAAAAAAVSSNSMEEKLREAAGYGLSVAYWVNPKEEEPCPPDSALCLAGDGDAAAAVGTLGLLGTGDSEVSLFLLFVFSLIGLELAGILRLEQGTGDRASGDTAEADVVRSSGLAFGDDVEFMLRSFG